MQSSESSYNYHSRNNCSRPHHNGFLFFVPFFLLFFFVLRGAVFWPFLIFLVIAIIFINHDKNPRSGYYSPRNSRYLQQNNNFNPQTTAYYQFAYCKHCGSVLEKDSNFCSACGQQI